jgi:hydrogenase maturation factor
MCLAIPALIKSVDGPSADVDMGGIETRISILFTPSGRSRRVRHRSCGLRAGRHHP